MRLSEISNIIKENLEGLSNTLLNVDDLVINNNQHRRVKNLIEFRQSINNLDSANLFQQLIEVIKKQQIFNMTADSLVLSYAEFKSFADLSNDLLHITKEFVKYIDIALPQVQDDEISIKLPEFRTFDEFFKILKILEKAFEQAIINETINGSVTIGGFEPGSRWINVKVGSQAAAYLIGTLVWAGVTISNQKNTDALMEENLRTKKLQNDALDAVVEANKRQIDLLIQTEAEHIYDEKFGNGPEQVEKLKLSIKSFAEIINMGGEVHPALSAPESIKLEFPERIPLHLIESRTKRIEKESTSDNDQD
ncbi:MAG: hypothetical protein COW65_09680 [Cytophagales bacterium CG18_big_fil_WC_8_21_14_2_50_42_9]|nr:MAG: hypothetical protein COW65_09680 [Cytophagales bacterium CG18_big_fil_WC_8_21_14_2_50_42_9]